MARANRSAGPRGGRPPLWTCPKCGHRFVTRNLWHSCVRVPLAAHFRGRPPALRAAFRAYVAAARALGPVTVYAQRTRIVFQSRVRFAGCQVRARWLDAGVWLHRRIEHPRVSRLEEFGPGLGYGVHFRLAAPADVDAWVGRLLREAYAIGRQERLAARAASRRAPAATPRAARAPARRSRPRRSGASRPTRAGD